MNTADYLRERDLIIRVLTERRKELGLGQYTATRLLNPGTKNNNVGNWERGDTSPRLDSLIKIAHAYGLRVTLEEWR